MKARKQVGAELQGFKPQRASVNWCFIQRKKRYIHWLYGSGVGGKVKAGADLLCSLCCRPSSTPFLFMPSLLPGTTSHSTAENDSLLMISALRRSKSDCSFHCRDSISSRFLPLLIRVSATQPSISSSVWCRQRVSVCRIYTQISPLSQ